MAKASPALVFLISVCLAALDGSSARAAQDMPDQIYSDGESPYAVWTAMEKVTLPDGGVDLGALHELTQSRIASYMDLPSVGPCIILQSIVFDHYTPGSLSQAVVEAEAILVGMVTGTAVGFDIDQPGTLVRVTPVEFLKSELEQEEGEYFVFLPIADFHLGRKSFCKVDSSFPEVPNEGDEVLLFFRENSRPSPNFVRLWDGEDVVFFANGQGELPESYVSGARSDRVFKNELLDRILGILNQEEEQ